MPLAAAHAVPARPARPRTALGWAVVVPALVVPLLGSLIFFVLVPNGAVGQVAYTLTKVFTLAYPLVFLRLIGTDGLRLRGKGTSSLRSILLTGLGSGLAIAGLGTLLMMTPLGAMVLGGADAVGQRADGLGFREHFVLYALFVCVIHSGLEEYYWRFFVYGRLRELCPRWAAHGIAGVAFAAHHLVITTQFFDFGFALLLAVSVAGGGIIWSLMYERHGTLLGGWLSHFCVDALLMVVGYQLLM